MEQKLKKMLKKLKMNEGSISTAMGGIVVVVMAMMIFNYFKSVNRTGLVTETAQQSSTEKEATKEPPTTYKVQKGDDLWHISEEFYGSGYNYVDIAKANRLSDPGVIEKGQELIIPKVEPKKSTKAAVTKVATAKVKTEKISIESDKYTVGRGDYLWSIAVRAYGDGYAWTKVYDANKAKIGMNPSLLFVGMELTLPR